MEKFKIGDKVKCINNVGAKSILKINTVYTVSNLGYGDSLMLKEISSNAAIQLGFSGVFMAHRFIKSKEFNNLKKYL